MRHVTYILAALAIATAVALAGYFLREEEPPPAVGAPEAMKELVMVVRPGPTDYFPGPDGSMIGLDADLARMFAIEKQLQLRFVTADTPAEIFAAIGRGVAHIGAGGLLRPLVSLTPPPAPAPVPAGSAADPRKTRRQRCCGPPEYVR